MPPSKKTEPSSVHGTSNRQQCSTELMTIGRFVGICDPCGTRLRRRVVDGETGSYCCPEVLLGEARSGGTRPEPQVPRSPFSG